nr:hypothetical protein [Tanacetum cinerariifolium]
MTRKPSISRRNRIHWHYLRDDALFSTIKVVSRHQATQKYGMILPIKLTTADIRNSKAYQEYLACAMGEAAPKPKASTRKKKGKQPLRATTPVEPTDLQRTEAEQLKIVLKQSREETHISQQSGSGTGEGTEVGSHEEGKESDDDTDEGSDNDSDETVKSGVGKDGDDEDDDDDDEEEELTKDDEEVKETRKGDDELRESEGESEEEEGSFDPIPRTPEDSEKESDDEEEQESRLSEEARIQKEEDADELYHDVNINQGRGLQVT